ncbi:MAG: GTP-binding protein [Planktothrix sp.]|uniref:GTP-binding protein n=1 Tax=Planktothrix sp. TaxID=3088171 RepID=UPI0038D44188
MNNHFNQARSSLKQTLTRYHHLRRQRRISHPELQATLQKQLEVLSTNLEKLEQGVIRIAVFGLVSRGKSAVLNALLGEKILQTGPLNGVTQWPRSVRWSVSLPQIEEPNRIDNIEEQNSIQVELIDTPGLDEVAGQVRGEMAKDVTRQADLILFVVSGDLTRTEYDALAELQNAHKPLIIVFNKIDLYTESEQDKIYHNLQQLIKTKTLEGDNFYAADFVDISQKSAPFEIVKVSAEPAPIQLRIEWLDGKITHEWESPPPQIDELKQIIVKLLNREGRSLLALNALVQAREAERIIARQSVELQASEAEELIWKFTRYKALAVALNPIAILDVLGATISDLILIRSLARLYGLPMTSYEAGKLWKKILLSSGGLLLAEMGSGWILGFGKSAAGLATDLANYAGIAITQASISAYLTYTVGQAAQVYLEKGCTWGENGIDTAIQEILNQVNRDSFITRLKQDIEGSSQSHYLEAD